jgi:two-component system, LytTR family, sensor kinase
VHLAICKNNGISRPISGPVTESLLSQSENRQDLSDVVRAPVPVVGSHETVIREGKSTVYPAHRQLSRSFFTFALSQTVTPMKEMVRSRWMLHVLFWLGYLLLQTYFEFAWISNSFRSMHPASRYFMAMFAEFSSVCLKIPQVYLTFFLLERFVFQAGKRWIGFLLITGTLAVFVILQRLIVVHFLLPFVYHDYTPTDLFPFARLASTTIDLVFVAALALFFKQLRSQMRTREREKQLVREKLETELQFLKAQINPHFLFNTLNNIYALARSNSAQTPDVVMKLSKLLRFMLYESEKPAIPIRQEVRLIEDYIDLERIRYNDRLHCSFVPTIDDDKQPITPLILLPLVENAFKYGISETRFDAVIRISLQLENGRLVFVISNSMEPEEQEIRENIGLKSLRRQLELIYSDYVIEIHRENQEFTLHLSIDLNSYATV